LNDLVRGQGRDTAYKQLSNGFSVAARERMALSHEVSRGDEPDLSRAPAPMRNRDSAQKLELERQLGGCAAVASCR